MSGLGAQPLLEFSVEDLVAARGHWDRIEAEVAAAQAELHQDEELQPPDDVALVALLMTLLSLEASASGVLLDFTLFALESLMALVHLVWQAASLPAVSAPVGTLSGLVAIILYLRDQRSDR